jgi:large subunit ribosomal protein L17
MRHKERNWKLGRNSNHRRQLLRNLSNSLIAQERIVTTLTRAKCLRKYVEPIITKAKNKAVSNIRNVIKKLGSDEAVNKIFNVIGPRSSLIDGGYIRITKLRMRAGDNAIQSLVEFV